MNSLILCLMIGAISACTMTRPENATQSPSTAPETLAPRIIPTTLTPAVTRTSAATGTSTPVATHTPSPTSTRQVVRGTPATPTRLPEPYLIRVLDWEIVQATSPTLCPACGDGTTVVQASDDLPIAVVQVSIQGGVGASSRLTTDLAYTSPDEINCTLEEGKEFCGLIFGQVVAGRITLTAQYRAGGEHQLEYLVTFQSWAEYQP